MNSLFAKSLAVLMCLASIGVLERVDAQDTRAAATTPAARTLDRSVLPIPEPKLTPITELDARNAKAPPQIGRAHV